MSAVTDLYKFGVLPKTKLERMHRRPKIAVAGGSISNRACYSLITTTDAQNQTFAPHNWLEWLQAFTGQPFQIVAMAGEGGRHITEVVTKFPTDVMQHKPDVVILGSDAIGNYLYNAGGATVDLAMGYLAQVHQMCRSIGAHLVVWDHPPNAQLNAANDASGAKTANTLEYNRRLYAYASENDDVGIVPFGRHVDLAAAGNRYNTTLNASTTATEWTHDGTHPHPKLAIDLATAMETYFSKYQLQKNWFEHRALIDPQSAITNPLCYGTGGTAANGASGTVAANCTLDAKSGAGTSVVGSKVARTDIGDGGEWQRVVATAWQQDVDLIFAGDASFPSNFGVGTPVRALVEVQLLSAPTNFRGFSVELSFGGAKTIAGFSQSLTGGFAQLGPSGPYIPLNKTMWLSTAIDEIPATFSAFQVKLIAARNGTAATAMSVDFRIGRVVIVPEDIIPVQQFVQTVP